MSHTTITPNIWTINKDWGLIKHPNVLNWVPFDNKWKKHPNYMELCVICSQYANIQDAKRDPTTVFCFVFYITQSKKTFFFKHPNYMELGDICSQYSNLRYAKKRPNNSFLILQKAKYFFQA